MLHRCILVVAVTFALAGQGYAAPSVSFAVDPANTIAGTTAYAVFGDGDGSNFLSAVMVMDLTAGSVVNGTPDSFLPQDAFWGVFPDLQWDTWFGIPGVPTNAIAGGGGDLGGGPLNASGTGNDAISVTWFNIDVTDTGLEQIANITLTDDAEGTWDLLVAYDDGTNLRLAGTVADLPEPASLALLAVGGLTLLRRR